MLCWFGAVVISLEYKSVCDDVNYCIIKSHQVGAYQKLKTSVYPSVKCRACFDRFFTTGSVQTSLFEFPRIAFVCNEKRSHSKELHHRETIIFHLCDVCFGPVRPIHYVSLSLFIYFCNLRTIKLLLLKLLSILHSMFILLLYE